MMRIGNILLALYLVFLSGWPCKDHDWVPPSQGEVEAVFFAGACSNDQPDGEDAGKCSPLCGCSCCSLAMEEVEVSLSTPLKPEVPGSKPHVSFSFRPYMLSADIWRPPVRV